MYTSKSNLEVAVEAAARVDAVLAKKGRIKPNSVNSSIGLSNSSKTQGDLFSTEFEINDVPLTARNVLTKGITQEEINHFSGASISTRGRYISREEKDKLGESLKVESGSKKDNKDGSSRPLYLFIQGPNKQSLDLAIQRIDSIIRDVMEQEMNKFKVAPPPPLMSIQTSLPGIEKVLVGLENAPPSFNVREKVLGAGGANLQYISNETGAVITLRGRGSGFPEPNTGQESHEPLHLCVEHQKYDVLQAGRQLAFNLIETIQQEFLQSQSQPPTLAFINNLGIPQGQLQTINVQPGEQLPPGSVTSIAVPVYTQQPMNQIVNVPPPSMAIPPPQLLQQPPPQVPPQQLSLPPPGIHIPPHQGPLVPAQQSIVQPQMIQQAPHGVTPSGIINQQPPPGQAVQQQVLVSQGATLLSQPPPVIAGQQATQVIPQQSQGFITHTTYPVQCIQANGQTLMAYPGMVRSDGQTQLQLVTPSGPPPNQAQLIPQLTTTQPPPQQAQLQPSLILQPGQPQQIQLAQLMQNHLGQPQAVTMLVQYQQQQGAADPNKPQMQQTRLGLAVLQQQQQRVSTPVQIQLQPGQQQIQFTQQFQQPPNQQIQFQHPGQFQQIQPGQQVQVQLQNQISAQPVQIQQTQLPQLQIQQTQQVQQVQIQSNPQMQYQSPQNTQIRPGQIVQQQSQTMRAQNPQEQNPMTQAIQSVTPTNQQQSQQEMSNQNQPSQQQNVQKTTNLIQQGQKRRYEGEETKVTFQGPPQPVPQPKTAQQQQAQSQSQTQTQPSQQQNQPVRGIGNAGQGGIPTAGSGQMVRPPAQLAPGEKQLQPHPPGAPDEWRNQGDNKQSNRGFDNEQNNESRQVNRGERPTFNHYSSKPQLYNANIPFHMHGLGIYPPPPPPPPPNNNSVSGGQYTFYQQQQPQHSAHQYPYWMMHQN
uniref:KH homology domain-containing protein 4 n=1 Tax=Clastoptera arizonana TaxID=38151 RepID=A0A1B6CZ42_9HEMI